MLIRNGPSYLMPWPGPQVTPTILMLEDPLLIATQSSPTLTNFFFKKNHNICIKTIEIKLIFSKKNNKICYPLP